MPNLHVDIDKKFPEGMPAEARAMALVRFWHSFHPSYRRIVIKEFEDQWDSTSAGVIAAVLKGLEQIVRRDGLR